MTSLATESTTSASGGVDRHEACEVFHVEQRHGRTGHRVELARYKPGSTEERILFGQRVDGVVRFLPGNLVVLVGSLGRTEDSTYRHRTTIRAEGCTKAVRLKRPNGASEPRRLAARQRENRS